MDELIDALRNHRVCDEDKCETCELMNDAADAIERLQRELLIVKAENEQFKLLMPGTMR